MLNFQKRWAGLSPRRGAHSFSKELRAPHAGDPALPASQPLIKTTREAFPSPSLLSKSCPRPWHHLQAAAPQFLGFWQGSPREYPGEGKRRARCGDNTAGRALKKPQELLGALP